MTSLDFPTPPPHLEAERLRAEVRDFLTVELNDRAPRDRAQSWMGLDPAFSRKLGEKGWLAVTWPKRYGGHERTSFERYVIQEELLAAGAPVAAHWIADRQSGPLILRFGTEEQRQDYLPRIARGDCYFCIGMSEPDSGSDLASIRTKAVPDGDGFRITGTKLWTTNGHCSHYMILLCRTSPPDPASRHGGTSQLIVDLTLPGVTISPVHAMSGEHHFNEVVFDDVLVPRAALIGRLGEGWAQVNSELAFERSGPERFLSSFALIAELVRRLGSDSSERAAIAVGRMAAHLVVLRRLSRSVAGMLQAGVEPHLQAAIVKDLGTLFEQEISEIARLLVSTEPTLAGGSEYDAVLAYTMLQAPSFSLRGGTREILRGIIARGLGVR